MTFSDQRSFLRLPGLFSVWALPRAGVRRVAYWQQNEGRVCFFVNKKAAKKL
jgi:hypothetical protein